MLLRCGLRYDPTGASASTPVRHDILLTLRTSTTPGAGSASVRQRLKRSMSAADLVHLRCVNVRIVYTGGSSGYTREVDEVLACAVRWLPTRSVGAIVSVGYCVYSAPRRSPEGGPTV